MTRRLGPFFLSCLLAFTAGHMFNYTVILYLQEVVGSDLLAGLGFGLAFGSSVVFGWLAGVLCDRVAPHRVIHGAQALFLAALACLWWAQAGASESARVVWVLMGAFLGGVAWSFVGPARLTTLAQIATAHNLRSASIVFNLQMLLGFGLAPLLIGLVRQRAGWAAVLAVAACCFVASSLLIAHLHTRATGTGGASVLQDVREGFAVVGTEPLLRQRMGAAVLAYAMTGPLQILLPKVARELLHLNELQRGAYLGLLALSLIGGGLCALALSRRLRQGWVVFGGVMLGGLLFASLAHTDAVALSAMALVCIGVAGGMVISLLVAGLQAQAPAAQRGRIMAMYSITSQVVPALSGVAAGALVQGVGLAAAVQACGLLLAGAAVLGAARMKTLRQLGSA